MVIGSGPNGLAAAIAMQREGLKVMLIEGKDTIGGGMRSAELTLPGYVHDVCSAIHPMALASPFFSQLPLSKYGLSYIFPTIDAAHPFDDGSAASVSRSVEETAAFLREDEIAYAELFKPLLAHWPELLQDILAPLHIPHHPLLFSKFGLNAILSAKALTKRFVTTQARGLFAGMAAHAMQPLTNYSTAATALVLMASAHSGGWPIPKGGSIAIANALGNYFKSIGGQIETGLMISSMAQLPPAHAYIFDVGPKQLLEIAGQQFSGLYKWQLNRFKYGMGVYKMDWALSEPIAFTNNLCRQAGTVHLGNTFEEIAEAEQQTWQGHHPKRPFVLLAQPSVFDTTRAPNGKHTAWVYCHVPAGSEVDMSGAIESQVERFAPGFRDTILARHCMNSAEMEFYNPNYVGGDINGGVMDLSQLFTRPALRLSPYKTSKKGIYICSSSTPPGGGVHGMCGYYAAKKALKDIFSIAITAL